MAISLLPLTTRLRQRLGGGDFAAAAVAEETVAPPTERVVPPALCLPDDPDRVLGFQEETTPELERQRAAGGLTQHAATRIAHYGDVTLIDGVAYRGGAMLHASNRYRQRPVVHGPRLHLTRAMLCTNPVIDRYFGHWLTDGLPLELLARAAAATPLTVSPHRWLHEPGYRALTGLEDHRARFVQVDELLVADDRGLNAGWQARITDLRSRIAARTSGHDGPEAVYIARGSSGAKRTLVNEPAVRAALAERGFATLEPETETPEIIARTLSAAKLIVTVEGSAQIHAMLTAPRDAWIIVIMPPHRFNCIGKVLADAIGLNWAYTVADDAGDGSFHQPLDRLLRLIDLTGA